MLREATCIDVGKGPALFVSPVMTETILRPCSGLDVYVGEGTWVKDLQCSLVLVPYRRTAEGPWLLLVSIRRFYCCVLLSVVGFNFRSRWSDVGKGPALFVSPIDVYAVKLRG
jgi:hypothetical protein